MQAIPPSDAADTPNGYIDQLYRGLPRMFSRGGSREEVTALLGGLAPALERTLGAPLGPNVGLRLFAQPWGWAPDDEPVAVDPTAFRVNPADPDPDFSWADGHGLIFVPAPEGRWLRWDPTAGPAPQPADGHMVVMLLLVRRDGQDVTICQVREVFGRDRSLDQPLYKPALRLVPANAAESAHLMGTLRALLGTKEAA